MTAQHLTLHNANITKGYGPKKSMEQEMLNGFGQLHLNKLPQTLLPKNHLGGFMPFLCSFLFGWKERKKCVFSFHFFLIKSGAKIKALQFPWPAMSWWLNFSSRSLVPRSLLGEILRHLRWAGTPGPIA